MKAKPNVLITNDDGIHAPGIKHLWNSLKDVANVTVIAPASEQSAVGLSLTIRHPLRIDRLHWQPHANIWSVSGTPADCVKMALSVVMDKKPDIIISGINRGGNAGRNVLYSGTVAGAIEGTIQGIPSVALSCWDYHETDYSITNNFICPILQHVMEHPLPKGTLLNVNFPSKSCKTIQGVKLTRQGQEYWAENPDKRLHPAEGQEYYWLGVRLAEFPEVEDSDVSWLKKGYVAAVPVHIGELTDHKHLVERKQSFDKFFSSSPSKLI